MLSRTRRWQRSLCPTEQCGPILTWLFLSFRFGPRVHHLGLHLPLMGTEASLPGAQNPQHRRLMFAPWSQVRKALRLQGAQEPTAQWPASVQRHCCHPTENSQQHTYSDGDRPGKAPPHQPTAANPVVLAATHTPSRCALLPQEAANTPAVSTSHWGPQARGQTLSAICCRTTCIAGRGPTPSLLHDSWDPGRKLFVS